MTKPFQTLSSKLVGILLAFFSMALVAISLTLYVSWQLEGGAAAINDAGSERMRSYRLAYLLTYGTLFTPDSGMLESEVRGEMASFEKILRDLERGDPSRPLFLPRDEKVRMQMRALRLEWSGRMRPLIESIIQSEDPVARTRLLRDYRAVVEHFVHQANKLVLSIEREYAYKTSLMRSIQLGLVIMAMVGTVILIFLMYLLVIRPITKLQEGMRRMAEADFSVRVPVESRDEFGALAQGFNQMADHLENLYTTLEERVESKTHSLEERNQQLSLLYEITSFLNEPASAEDMCHRFLRRLMGVYGADGAAVRLVDDNQAIHLMVTEGLTEDFSRKESCIKMGECLCGYAADARRSVSFNLSQPSGGFKMLYNCRDEGFQTVSVFIIRVKQKLVGIFNLYFREEYKFTPQEERLLETVGQHLGAAIEGQRLVSREKEMAISEERNLLAQELHDSIAQGLAFLNIQVQLLGESLENGKLEEMRENIAHIRAGVQESYDDVRELLVHFRTRVHQSDMESAIRSALEKFEGQTGIRTHLLSTGSGAPLDATYEPQVLHIVQESLSNIRKHAGASEATVEVSRGAAFVIAIRDNGKGFDPARAPGSTHVGLDIMRERAHRIGGRLEVFSAPGEGAEIRLTIDKTRKESA